MRSVYLDASALVKLVLDEPESASLAEHLADEPISFTSIVSAVEAPRAASRMTGSQRASRRAREIVDQCRTIPLDERTIALAASAAPAALASLDAIHLASALAVRDLLDSAIVYDRRLAQAFRSAGLDVVAPGQSPG